MAISLFYPFWKLCMHTNIDTDIDSNRTQPREKTTNLFRECIWIWICHTYTNIWNDMMLTMMIIEIFLNFIRFLENNLQHLCVVHKAKRKRNAPGWRVWVWQFRNKHNWTMTRIWNFYFPPKQLYTYRCLYNSSHLFTALCNFHFFVFVFFLSENFHAFTVFFGAFIGLK